ncbi:HelD family protein [Clostridium grantii]|uniref:DNA helicase-2 / ATP-dependent DNA helicase PcrA n=1 Tax=Clostridium grantii DSM 8605 TaxID=1121316 RepID=A0A1M5UBU1_9CLOT|nr:UvrD-helicase domain-containing protein [Clostridium grantii]SHH60474.1 DNA helicase-2 / ATP-dependent DNA helicase PcrA [Clostridium grantii DSM 8605]
MFNESDLQATIKEELQKEMEKTIELEREEEFLESTIGIIKRELLYFLEKRKAITETIKEERKIALEDYKDDEDKLIEFFDHERYVNEESFRIIDRKLKELTILQDSPYFGKVNFKEKDFNDEEDIYVGRFGMTTEASYEPLVVDWRAPIASLFYAGKLGEAKYKAPMGEFIVDIIKKRQFIIKNEVLEGMFDSSVEVKDDILQMMLSKNSGDKLKDIIMSIQAEQDEIIRQDRNKAVIVDGVAGSGKTTIALHRVAYLLYNHRDTLQDKVMILGPNTIFMEYISSILPSLGEIGVNQKTFLDFALEVIELDYEKIMSVKDYMEKIINKDEEFIQIMRKKTSDNYIKELDKLIENFEKDYYKLQDVVLDNKVIVEKNTVKELFEYYANMPLFRKIKKIKRILISKILDERDNKIRAIEKWYKESLDKLTEEEKNVQENNLIFKRRDLIRIVIKSVIEAKESLNWLSDIECIDIYNEFNNNEKLNIDDLAPILYLKIKLEGLELEKEIKHVVIDEAQDYSFLQFVVIKELTKAVGYTIVGDTNQLLLPIDETIAMTRLSGLLENTSSYKLKKSYRSTKEIMEYANKYLDNTNIIPLVRNGEMVKEINLKKEEINSNLIEIVNSYKAKGLESIAIITNSLEKAKIISDFMKEEMSISFVNSEDSIYKKGVVILPSYFAKGLEFDGAIIIDDFEEQAIEDRKIKYVMATRALHDLTVVKNN